MQLTNTTSADMVFGDSGKIIKFVNHVVVPANSSININVELVVPLVMFDQGFQNSVANGLITLNFGSVNPSRTRRYLCAIRSMLNASTNWAICLLPGQSSSSSSCSSSFSSSSSSFSSSSFSSSSFSSSSSSFSSSSFSSSSSSFSSSSSSSP